MDVSSAHDQKLEDKFKIGEYAGLLDNSHRILELFSGIGGMHFAGTNILSKNLPDTHFTLILHSR